MRRAAGLACVLLTAACTLPAQPLPQDPTGQPPETPTVVETIPLATGRTVVPAPVPKVTTCDRVREAILTGTHAQVVAAMKALMRDRAMDANAREAAKGWLNYEAKRKTDSFAGSMQEMYESLIQTYCQLG